MSRCEEDHYVTAALTLYRSLSSTVVRSRRSDRALAIALHRRGVSVATLEAALRLALARRTARPTTATPLAPIRSLHYFLPLIEELANAPCAERYLDYLTVRRSAASNHKPTTVQISTDSDDR